MIRKSTLSNPEGFILQGTLSDKVKQLFKLFVKTNKKKTFSSFFLAEIKLWVLLDIVLHCQFSKFFFIHIY